MYYLSSSFGGRVFTLARRLTVEALEERLAEYCRRYEVVPGANGLPPYPAGRRETPQHREWMALHRSQKVLAAREATAR
jgi:hypothetical protein